MSMKKSKVEWIDYNWNPITGCKYDCPYCYAKQAAVRFAGDYRLNMANPLCKGDKEKGLLELEQPFKINGHNAAYPFAFIPTLHKYALKKPREKKMGANIFVGSMAEMFGEWVPDEWINLVFDACKKYDWHNYLFQTKNPDRYVQLRERGLLLEQENIWYGTTMTENWQKYFADANLHTFLSLTPIQGPIDLTHIDVPPDWVIIGKEFGNRNTRITPQKKWIVDIAEFCTRNNIPFFMDLNMEDIMGVDFIQEIPAALKNHDMSPKQKERLIGTCFLCHTEKPKRKMHNLRSRNKDNKSDETFGYLCDECYQAMKNAIENKQTIEVHEDENR